MIWWALGELAILVDGAVVLPNSHTFARVTTIVHTLGEAQTLQLAAGLLQGNIELSTGALDAQQYIRTGITETGAVVRLLRRWQQSGWTAENLGIAIISANTGYRAAIAESPEVNLVWTGPALAPVRARSTVGVLLELIEKAQSELIIVGYVLTDGAAAIFEAMVAAQRKGYHRRRPTRSEPEYSMFVLAACPTPSRAIYAASITCRREVSTTCKACNCRFAAHAGHVRKSHISRPRRKYRNRPSGYWKASEGCC